MVEIDPTLVPRLREMSLAQGQHREDRLRWRDAADAIAALEAEVAGLLRQCVSFASGEAMSDATEEILELNEANKRQARRWIRLKVAAEQAIEACQEAETWGDAVRVVDETLTAALADAGGEGGGDG